VLTPLVGEILTVHPEMAGTVMVQIGEAVAVMVPVKTVPL
jgi:hypothetical protein